ncbi:MAG: type II toxin-antitoxin system RelE/ParE family toxin [Zoogloeaceae bacterium]|jgi:plasmid stabilization system protein ParE|nr:type II toxin-antitoxin system RelE/ParE family toxin [Zoogloeaceae bacterium]
MLPVFWLETADANLAEITEYIGQHDVDAAERMWHLLRNSVLPLSEHPYLYRTSERVPGLREIVAHPNYIVFYRVAETRIEVVNVVHARREFPGQGE